MSPETRTAAAAGPFLFPSLRAESSEVSRMGGGGFFPVLGRQRRARRFPEGNAKKRPRQHA